MQGVAGLQCVVWCVVAHRVVVEQNAGGKLWQAGGNEPARTADVRPARLFR